METNDHDNVAYVVKRDGRKVEFSLDKISQAINKAFIAVTKSGDISKSKAIAKLVESNLLKQGKNSPTVEEIQDEVEKELIASGLVFVAKAYIIYRSERTRNRKLKSDLNKVFNDITFGESKSVDSKRENANINTDCPMGAMLKYGSESVKQYYQDFIINPRFSKAHRQGDIHIHDLDFYTLTTTCCQIDIDKLFTGGFSTGIGSIREPNSIASYAALLCIAIQSNQNEQHGGQSIPNFDHALAKGVWKTFKKLYSKNLLKFLEISITKEFSQNEYTKIQEQIVKDYHFGLENNENYFKVEMEKIIEYGYTSTVVGKAQKYAYKNALKETDEATYQAMESMLHNLNTMHSRAGAQVPFSSINYGTNTTPEGRMVIKNVLLALESGLGNNETPLFPIHIFRVKEGINFNPGDINYDLFQLAIKVSAKRLFPNFSFQDAPFNAAYYKGTTETEISYMGCRTRVVGNSYDKNKEIVYGRGNLSFTSINLPRIAIKSKGDINWFYEELERVINLVVEQLEERFEIIALKKVYNFPFLMGQGVWLDSDKLKYDQEIREVLKHGTLSVGFIGLAETLTALINVHHGQSEKAQNLGLDIVSFMRKKLDEISSVKKLNFSLIATPAEGLSGRFINLDKKQFGQILGVTDKIYYTNSFHVPVSFKISANDKIKLEAPYHSLTNAGHITYVELDGDPSDNLEAFESIIRRMKEYGIGYGAINHPVDYDPVCGYNGIIKDVCPRCNRSESEHNARFERIRRITGYLVGTLDRFNNAKRAEVEDRVKHNYENKN